jgi:4-alpha-glucanotransferase
MRFNRSSGILFHPTSLPGPYGIGDIGPQARLWVDFLSRAGCRLWQILPLGPTGYGDSPYQCFSAFAGNPYLISPDLLLEEGLLTQHDLFSMPSFGDEMVDYGAVIPWKLKLLDRAFELFSQQGSATLRKDYHQFQEQHSSWLDDFAMFMALKEYHGGGSWVNWQPELRDRVPEALQQARETLSESIQKQMFRQYVFFHQWADLRQYVKDNDMLIIGDIPIFVAHDSADVWANPELFYLKETGEPEFVAGVPPDYFSPTGQLWGNPLYRWNLQVENGYQWWVQRFRSVLSLVDIVRLDHFRGFAGYWEIAGEAETAEKGRWVPGPGGDFLIALEKALGELPIIAEDLGVITPDVIELRDTFNLPGMKILQFSFAGGPTDKFLPHNYTENYVVYTGTHDNDTVRGWYERVPEKEKDFYRRYLQRDGSDVSWDMIRSCWSSVAVYSIAPLQDFLGLGNEARMNYPGNPSGNWTWRISPGALDRDLENKIYEINYLYSRLHTDESTLEGEPEAEVPEDYFEINIRPIRHE